MKTVFAFVTAAGLCVFGASALAVGDPASGEGLTKEKGCVACHGAATPPPPTPPKLEGQHADYLERALHDYRSGARSNGIMGGMAATLTDAEIRDIAAWFASQNGGVYTVERD